MKRALTLILIIFLALQLKAQETLSLSLEQAIAYALENSMQVKNARLEHEGSDYQVNEILADGLPQVNATAGLTNNIILPKTVIDVSSFQEGVPPGTTQEVTFSTKYTAFVDLRLEQMIFDASYFIGLKAAKTLKELTERDVILSEIGAQESVSKAYYTALVNQERLKLFERQLNTTDTLLRETEAMYENGFAEKIDVSRIKVQFNNLSVEKTRFEKIADLSLDLLKFQMGMPINQPIVLTDDLDEVNIIEPVYDMATFEYSNRYEFARLLTSEKLQEINIRNIRSGYYPTLNGFANIGANSGANKFSRVASFDFQGQRAWFENAGIGFNINVPVFDSFRKKNQIQKVRVTLEQINNEKEMLRSNIDIQILQAQNDLSTANDNLEAQKENLDLSREIYDVSKIKYQEGVGSNIEVINATTTYKEAEINYYNALYDALIAKVDLQKSLGTLNQ